MPVPDDIKQKQILHGPSGGGPQPEPPTTFGEQMTAAFGLENVATNIAQQASLAETEGSPEFDPLENLEKQEQLLAPRFVDDESRTEMDQTRRQLEREHRYRQDLADGPVNSFLAGTIAAAVDIPSLVPGGAGLTATRSLGQGALRGVASGAVINAGAEAALQETQETRSVSESITATLLGGGLGGGFGAAGAGLRRAVDTEAARAADEEVFNQAVRDFSANIDDVREKTDTPASAGAASARPDPSSTELAPSFKVNEAVSKFGRVGLAAPGLELSASRFPRVRERVQQLVDSGLYTKGNKDFQTNTPGGTLDTRIKAKKNVFFDRIRSISKDSYKKYRKSISGSNSKPLSKKEFDERITQANIRGDRDPIPEVQEAAQRFRNEVYEPLRNDAESLGLVKEGILPRTAVTFAPRVYDREKVKAFRDRPLNNGPSFKQRVKDHIIRTGGGEGNFVDESELDAVADDVADQILGNPAGRLIGLEISPRFRGSLKERTLLIEDTEIEDFLVKDANIAGRSFVNTMVSDVEMTRLFGRADPEEMVGREIKDEVNRFAREANSAEEARKIEADGERQIAKMQTLLEKLRGIDRASEDPNFDGIRRSLQSVRQLGFLNSMGSVVISSVPDLGLQVMQEGISRSFGTQVANFASGFKAFRLAKQEAEMAGVSSETRLGERSAALFDTGDQMIAETTFEQGLQATSTAFSRINLLAPWTDAMKGITSEMVSTRIIDSARKVARGQSLTEFEQTRLARSGINPDLAAKIGRQAEGEGRVDFGGGTVKVARTQNWDDPEAIQAFRNALVSDVENTVITPGVGDAPLWTSTEWGKTIFQFKRFGSAVLQKGTLAGLQRRDMAALNGTMSVFGLGLLGVSLRDIAMEGEIRERDTRQWVAEGIDRSGLIMMFTELDAISDKAVGMSAMRAISGETPSRFARRDVLGQALGPGVGTVEDLAAAAKGGTGALTDSEDNFITKDLERLRRTMPGQNLFYLRGLFDNAIKNSGLPEDNNN